MEILKVEHVSKVYGEGPTAVKALDDISFSVNKGEFVAIIGPSGSGKSTLLHILGGVDYPSSGNVYIDQTNIYDLNETQLAVFRRRQIGLIYQFYNLMPVLNVRENVTLPLLLDHRKVDEAQLDELLKTLGLSERVNHLPNELSGGQQQRIALARALAINPKVLLLDEPFSSLDTKLREEMRELTLSIQRQKKITMIMVTHDKEEAMMCSDSIAVMLDGEIKQIGTPREIYYYPNCKYVADFMGDKNYVRGEVKNNEFISTIGKWKVNHTDCARVLLMIRPEDIELSTNVSEWVGTIVDVKFAGERIFYKIDVCHTILKTVQPAMNVYALGETVGVRVSMEAPILFENKDV